jgi:replicative DNA helicase
MDSNKLLATEAEQSVLGGVLLDSDQLQAVFLCPEDFHDKRHRLIFAAMLKLSSQGEPIDSVTLTSRFHQDNLLSVYPESHKLL